MPTETMVEIIWDENAPLDPRAKNLLIKQETNSAESRPLADR